MSVLKATFKDFQSDQDVRWCPGCGDYSILAAVQRLLPSLDIPKENHVFISGIGCAARFPYYMSTYGFHTIHGRAPALATGVKLANPELTVWVISGDGDSLSIGGNHFMHLMRRNVNINFLLFNNRIYGLTKGQYSPTSEKGKVTKSTPAGSCDTPVDPAGIALAAGATFVGRALAVDPKGLTAVLKEAVAHDGTSFVEIFQNCNVFNDGAFDDFAERTKRDSEQIMLQHGKPALFAGESKGLRLKGLQPEVFDVEDPADALTYDQYDRNMAKVLSTLPRPEFPVPMGVLFKEERQSYEALVHQQIETPAQDDVLTHLQTLLQGSDSWTVS